MDRDEFERGDVLVHLTFPRSNTGERRIDLSVEERVSGEVLVRLSMSADQFADLMSSTSTYVGGAYIVEHPERIGKRMQVHGTSIGHAADPDEQAEQVRQGYLNDGWDTARIDRTNFGRRVVAYRWVEVSDEH